MQWVLWFSCKPREESFRKATWRALKCVLLSSNLRRPNSCLRRLKVTVDRSSFTEPWSVREPCLVRGQTLGSRKEIMWHKCRACSWSYETTLGRVRK